MKILAFLIALALLFAGVLAVVKIFPADVELEESSETSNFGYNFVKRFEAKDFREVDGKKYVDFEKSMIIPYDREIRIMAKVEGEVLFYASGCYNDSENLPSGNEIIFLETVLKGSGYTSIHTFTVPSSGVEDPLYLSESYFEGSGSVEWIEVHVRYLEEERQETVYGWRSICYLDLTQDSMSVRYTYLPDSVEALLADGGNFRMGFGTNSSDTRLYLIATVNGVPTILEGSSYPDAAFYFEFYPKANDVITDIYVVSEGITDFSISMCVPLNK